MVVPARRDLVRRAGEERDATRSRTGTSGRQAWPDQAACRDRDPDQFFPEPGDQAKAAGVKAICASCQVRDHCLDLAVTAAGGLDQDHGVFGGTLPVERSRLRGNTFPSQASTGRIGNWPSSRCGHCWTSRPPGLEPQRAADAGSGHVRSLARR